MIIGECPYEDCRKLMMNPYKSNTMQKIDCDGCGRQVWLQHSNLDPISYTDEEFLEKYKVDEDTKSISIRGA